MKENRQVCRLPTVSVCVSAYNEEKNIGVLLESISGQRQGNHRLKSIIVVCDGCTDGTAKTVQFYVRLNKKIKLVDDRRRIGRAGRLSYFCNHPKADILVTLDADTKLAHPHVLEKIVKKFEDPLVGLVGCGDQPCPPYGFVEKIVVAGIRLWYEIRKDVNSGRTIHNHHGCASAISRFLARRVDMPADIFGTDDFTYHRAVQLGYKFEFAPEAIVYYRAPQTVQDFFIQSTRFINIKHKMAELFGPQVYLLYQIPLKHKLWGTARSMLKDPCYTSLAILLQITLRIVQDFYKKHMNHAWTTITSSKTTLAV